MENHAFREILQDTRNRLLTDNQSMEDKINNTITYLNGLIQELQELEEDY